MNTNMKKKIYIIIYFIVVGLTIYFLFSNGVNMPQKAKTEHIILISIDALFTDDYTYINNLPNFRRFFFKGTVAREVKSIFPTLTYPVHTSIITGVKPNRHKIYNNIKFQPGIKEPEWNWYYEYISSPTIIDLVKEHNMKTAAFLWPVTAGATPRKIDYNVPEIWPVKGENQVWLSLRTGSFFFILKNYFKFGHILDGINQPNLDDFTTAAVCDLIKSKKPNLTLVHLLELDMIRHRTGVHSAESIEVLRRMDERIGRIIDATREAGIYDNTTIIMFGDHGFVDINKKVSLNAIFKNEELLTFENNNLTSWKAYANSFDGGAYIYINNEKKQSIQRQTYNKVLEILKQQKYNGIIEKIYDETNFQNLNVDGDFTFIALATPGYYIVNDWHQKPPVKEIDKSNLKNSAETKYIAMHGYRPDLENYNTLLLAKGSGIKKSNEIKNINLIDIAPTVAKLFGLKMHNTDGSVIENMLDK